MSPYKIPVKQQGSLLRVPPRVPAQTVLTRAASVFQIPSLKPCLLEELSCNAGPSCSMWLFLQSDGVQFVGVLMVAALLCDIGVSIRALILGNLIWLIQWGDAAALKLHPSKFMAPASASRRITDLLTVYLYLYVYVCLHLYT